MIKRIRMLGIGVGCIIIILGFSCHEFTGYEFEKNSMNEYIVAATESVGDEEAMLNCEELKKK